MIFSNVGCITDKLEGDGKIQQIYDFIFEILKGEISFAMKEVQKFEKTSPV